jgi:tetratricopeptide (TPR) repeat protein
MRPWIKLSLYSIFSFLVPLSSGHCHLFPHSNLVKRAEQLFAEGHFTDAIPLYQQMLYADFHPSSELALHLAACYLEISQPQSAIELLHHAPLTSDRIYLLSTAYRMLKEHQKAINILNSSPIELTATPNQPGRLVQEMDFERGLNLFHLKRFDEANACFEAIFWQPTSPQLYYLAQIYLARIAILNKQLTKASRILNQFELPSNNPLTYEKIYLAGLICFASRDYAQAIGHFENALPTKYNSSCAWMLSLQRCLISSYLHEAIDVGHDFEKVSRLLEKAQIAINNLTIHPAGEIEQFLQGDLFLLRGELLHDKVAFQSAKAVFSDIKHFNSPKTKLYAALKIGATLPDYQSRVTYYQDLMLTHAANQSEQIVILNWSGLHALREGLSIYHKNQPIDQSSAFFESARAIFKKAYLLSLSLNAMQANHALRYYSFAVLFDRSHLHLEQSAEFLRERFEHPSSLFDECKEPGELLFLTGLIWKRLAEKEDAAFQFATQLLNQVMDQYPSSSHSMQAAKSLGVLYMQKHEWRKAEGIFRTLIEKQPQYFHAKLLVAMCAEKLNQSDRKRELLKAIFSQNPYSAEAPVAYFYLYNYREYLKGHRKAIKHLQSMPALFPDHPLIISAHYLIGLDYLKDHQSEEGSILRRKDLIAAIDAFQQSETAFDSLMTRKLISTEALPYFVQTRYKAMQEKALANLAVADCSHGAKRQIYLEYAEEVFLELIGRLQHADDLINSLLINNQTNPHLLEESYYWLAITKIKKNQYEDADETLNLALKLYEKAHESQGYLLSRIWYEKGKIAGKQKKHADAIACFQCANEAGIEKLSLSPDQKLDLWIEQSLSYKESGDFENAMLLLSKAVNDEAISGLRVKAMYLRSELYDLQGRPELALKQLEAVSKKGGEWGKLAKDKLEGYYGY